VLFDSGASHSFVTMRFVAKGGLTASQMARNIIVQILGSQVRAHLSCEEVPIDIHGVSFQANLIILGTKGLDVVLGMDWMSKVLGAHRL
jgi:hypothetical protein